MDNVKKDRKYPRQLRLTDENAELAEKVWPVFQEDLCQNFSFNLFCNKVLEEGLKKLSKTLL